MQTQINKFNKIKDDAIKTAAEEEEKLKTIDNKEKEKQKCDELEKYDPLEDIKTCIKNRKCNTTNKKQIMFRLHPDKNPACKEYATTAMQNFNICWTKNCDNDNDQKTFNITCATHSNTSHSKKK